MKITQVDLGLQFQRQEYKYLLSYDQYLKLKLYFGQRGLTSDSYSGIKFKRSYYVGSLYFDTPDYQAYWQKMYGVEQRVKYRIRSYSQTASAETPVFWEIKRKIGDYLKKERLRLPWSQTQQFLGLGSDCHRPLAESFQNDVFSKFYFNKLKHNLAPVVLVSYWREPWLDPFYPRFRLTFDYQIKAQKTMDLFSSSWQALVVPDHVIMEIKFTNSIPAYLHQINQYFNLSRQSLSKYCLALEACDIVAEAS